MKKIATPILFGSAMAIAFMGCSGETAKKAASKMTKKTIEITKGTLTGIGEGIDDGRKAAESMDGALIITNSEEFSDNVSFSLASISQNDSSQLLTFEVAFENKTDKPIRISGLCGKGNSLIFDKEGFAYELKSQQGEITIPPKAKIKTPFHLWNVKTNSFDKMRIYGKEVGIPEDIERKSSP